MNKLLYLLTAGLPCKQIMLDGRPYLERYYLGTLLGVTFYLHRFISSDTERHLHNHPWNWGRALVLSGGYVEESVRDICPHAGPSGCILNRRYIHWWNKVDGRFFHRISNAKPGTWTLFFHGRRATVDDKGETLKGWGFLDTLAMDREPYRTVFFHLHPPSNLRWWLTAPKGRDAGRVLM